MRLQSRIPCQPCFLIAMTPSSRSGETLKRRATGSEEALLSLIQAADLGCVTVDTEGRIQDWNEGAERLLGWKKDEVLSRSLTLTHLTQDGGEVPGSNRCEVSFRGKNQETLRVEVRSAPHPDGKSRILLLQDVTEKKFLEKALLEAAEREQRRIGQELHDGLCQHLLGAAFSAKALAGALDREQSKQAAPLHDLARLINDAVSQVRDISRGLHPVEQDTAGLMSALQELANRSRQSSFQCDKRVLVGDASKAGNAYRIAQETVAVLLQAGVKKIDISLAETGGQASLRIAGEGGRESELTANPAGVAARILHYRAQAMHGSVSLDFDPEKGTQVTCLFSP